MKPKFLSKNKFNEKFKFQKKWNLARNKTAKLLDNIKRRDKRTIALLSTLGIICLLFICSSLYSWLNKKNTEKPAEILSLQTVRVKELQMPEFMETIGTLVATEEVMIKAPAIGKVQDLIVESGSWVKSGTKLINLIGAPEVRAPFDGYLGDWHVKPGEIVQSNADLIELVNAQQLTLSYRLPEQSVSKLDFEQEVEIAVKAFPDKVFKGKVNYVAPMVDKKTYTVLVKAKIQNEEHELWPGMSAHVKHYFSIDPKALVVPESALMLTLEGYELFVVDQTKGKVIKRKVTVGSRDQGRVQIKSGVTLNEPIVITRTDNIKDGLDAKAVDWVGTW